uniref:Uncharacterized protein n=1 Tax=Cyprinus carpio TaxID=7962 RepID=A0A8C1RFE9_CYPCA
MDDTQTPRDKDFSPGCSSVDWKRSEAEPSCVFMKSDESTDHPQQFSSVHQKKSDPEPSCVSMKSDKSMHHPFNFKSDDTRLILQHRSDVRKPVCEKYDQPMNQPQDGTYPDVRLIYCGVTDEGCAALASALRLNPSHLRELDLSENKLGDSVKLLSDVLQNPHCKLEKLRLIYCGITYEGCAALASALRSNPTHLRHLDLSWNKLGDSVKLLSDVIQSPHCKLKKLRLYNCGITDEGCAALASALSSNPSHLRELSLTWNELGDSVKLLSDVLQNPHCKLEKLWLYNCGVTDEGCAALASALRSNPSHLRELDLSVNKLGDSVKLLSDVLRNPHCKLEKLWLSLCGVTDEGCAALASALRSNPSHLRELSLSWNKLESSSLTLLCAVLEDPHCKLEKLWLYNCGVKDEGCAALASALRSNPSHLRELDLSGNSLGKSEMKLLSDLKDDTHYKLQTLDYCECLFKVFKLTQV